MLTVWARLLSPGCPLDHKDNKEIPSRIESTVWGTDSDREQADLCLHFLPH